MAKPVKISIIGDASKFHKAMGGVSKRLGGLTTGPVAKLGAALGGVFAAREAIQFGKDSVGVASDIEEALSKVTNVFGDSTAQITEVSGTAAKALGISKADYLDYAGSIGAAITAAGIESEQATELTTRAVQNFADMASFHNNTAEDVAASWQSAMRGSYEPIQKYMPFINDEFMKTYGVANGLIDENTKKLDVNSRAIILDAIAMDEKLNPAYNDFEETSGGLANQQRILQAQFENVKGELGAKLLPVVTKFFVFLNDNLIPASEKVVKTLEAWWTVASPYITRFVDAVRPKIEQIIEFVQKLVGRFQDSEGEINAVVEKVKIILGRLRDVWFAYFEAAQAVVERVVKIVTAIWEEGGSTIWGQTKSFLKNVWEAIQGAFDVIEGLFELVKAVMTGNWGDAWDAIKKIVSGAWTVIKGLVRAAWDALGAAFEVGRAALKLLMQKVWDGIKSKVQAGITGVAAKVATWIREFKQKFIDLKTALKTYGRQMIEGLKQGLVGKWWSIKNWVTEKVNWIKDQFTSGFGILSPSRVFQGYGENIVEGLNIGLQKGTKGLDGAMGRLIDAVQPPPVMTAPLAVATQPVGQVTPGSYGDIIVNAHTDASPNDIAREVSWAIRGRGGLQ